jgi:hypothetical protein
MTESTVESAALVWLEAVGWQVAHGLSIIEPSAHWNRAKIVSTCLR